MKERLVIVGGHGSAEMAMSVFEAANTVHDAWEIEGYLTDIRPPGDSLGRHPVLGGTEEAADFVERGFRIHYALLFNAKHKRERVRRFLTLNIPAEAHVSAIHPAAHVDPSVRIGRGVLIDALVGVSVNALVGDHVHMYQHAFLNHDASLSAFVTAAPHAVIGARVQVGEGAHVGLNASIREDTTIGEYSIIGMGAVVINDVADGHTVVGNPARPIGTVT